MKKILRALLAWLDRKFPDRVIVTLTDYNALLAKVERFEAASKVIDEWAKKTTERLEKNEIAINNLNVTAGLAGMTNKLPAFSR